MNLDLIDEIKKVDSGNLYASIPDLPKQCQHAWDEAVKVTVPIDYKNIDNLVMCGMGGSGLGARVIESVYKSELKIPLTRVNDYDLPNFVNDHSLVICSSYSGTTEETLENYRQAKERKSKIIVIGAGGKIIEDAKSDNIPYYQILPTFNTSGQPRMAIGYSIMGQINLLSGSGVLDFTEADLKEIIIEMESVIKLNNVTVPSSQNPAKILAHELFNKAVILVSGGHLVGATHVLNNQINENSKTFSADFSIPELNHHLMEGLFNPRTNPENLHFLFIDSNIYSAKLSKRIAITKDVVSKNDIVYSVFSALSKNKMSQVFELIQFGAFTNYYLAMLLGQNPIPIVWVDYFKAKLAQ